MPWAARDDWMQRPHWSTRIARTAGVERAGENAPAVAWTAFTEGIARKEWAEWTARAGYTDWTGWTGWAQWLDSAALALGSLGGTGRLGVVGLAGLLAKHNGSRYSTEKCLCRITVIRLSDAVALLAFAP